MCIMHIVFLDKSVSMYCLYVNCFCTVWSTLSRISLTKAHVLCGDVTIKVILLDFVISRLDYCNVLLAGLPSNTIKPLQMIQNAAARLVFNEPKRAHVTPLFVSLHWLPVAARIQFKTLMLAYRTTTNSEPAYFHSLLRIYIPSRSLRSASERCLVVPSQRGSQITLQNILVHHSLLEEWSSHPHPECWIPVDLQATTEN